LQIASDIDVPATSLIRKSAVNDAQKVIELAEDVQELVTEEAGELLKSTVEDQREEGTSEAARGNSPSHNISDSITDLVTSSPSSSSETSSTPSPSTKNQKKAC
jgi:hypothetical protein